jgi:hypothetical protein
LDGASAGYHLSVTSAEEATVYIGIGTLILIIIILLLIT